jgi:iron complex outermembrane receptor protein
MTFRLDQSVKNILLLTALVLIFQPVYVAAQDTALEEIVVTARKRAENLQDVPATVTAFSSEMIEQAGIVSMRDYVGLTSNLTLQETQNNAFAFVNIRGLSTIRNVDPTVAVVLDGVLATTSLSFSQDMYDIEQIEVLKGPQGALYGRNATGGAINITTKQPTDEMEGFLRAGYGNGDNKSVVGSISGPLIADTLLGAATISYRDADGWRTNIATDTEVDPYQDVSFRGKLLWNAADNLKVDLRYSYADTESTGSQFVSTAPNFVSPPNFPANANLPGNGTAAPIPGLPPSIALLVGDPNNTSVRHQANEPGTDDREGHTLSAKIDWDTELGTVTSISAYDKLDHITAGDQFPYFAFVQVAGTPDAGTHPASVVVPPFAAPLAAPGTGFNATFGQNRFHEAFSQELKITSSDDQRLRWIFGGYYAATELDVMISTNNEFGQGFVEQSREPNIGGINPTIAWNLRFVAPLLPIIGGAAFALNPNTNPTALAYNLDHNDNAAYAIFGQAEYDLTDTLELSVALRYDRDERELTIMTPQQFLPVFPTAGREGDVRARNFDSLQPKVTLRWQPTEDLTLYGTYAQGFRSGGFNLSGVAAGVNALVTAGVPGLPQGVNDSFEQEDTEGLEGGFKATLAEGRLNLGGSVFYTEVDDAFTFVFVAPFTAQTTRNIDKAEILGGELYASWLPVDGLQLDVSAGVLDSEIKSSSWIGAGGINIVGKELPLNPDYTLNVGISYSRQITSAWNGFIRFDYQRLGEMFFEPENFAARDDLDLLNLRFGISEGSGWELVAWGRNITNKDYLTESSNTNGISFFAKPRQYGLELTKRF